MGSVGYQSALPLSYTLIMDYLKFRSCSVKISEIRKKRDISLLIFLNVDVYSSMYPNYMIFKLRS